MAGGASSAGVIDSCGFKKDGYYFYQSQWTRKPMLHLFPHWNWKGREGQVTPVTATPTATLWSYFVNGKSSAPKG